MPEGGSPDVTQLVDRAVTQGAATDVSGPARPTSAADLARAQREAAAGRRAGRRAVVKAYVSLTKPRIVELLLITTIPAMLLAERGVPSLWLMAVVLVGGSLAAGAANALNCYIDRDIDPLMKRTSRRPLATHSITPRAVLVFGLTLAALSTVLMAVFTNVLATLLTVGAIAYYDLVYTLWLKRTTPQNTVWGGACGAAPVLIGWAAVTGGLAWPAWVMFAVVFLWQPPHFYALAIKFKDDYARAGIPMLPVVASMRRVGLETVVYSWLTVAASIALWPFGMTPVYGVVALVVGALLLLEAHRLDGRARRGEPLKPMRLFHWSVTYLTLLCVAVGVDVFIQ
jgi:protoheme IX farnesyltransferase